MEQLKQQKCTACRPDAPPATAEDIAKLQPQIPEWSIIGRDSLPKLERVYIFKDFAQALAFTNRVGAIAEDEGHHPLIQTEWGRVTVRWWTHKIRNLHVNDFIMAAKTDREFERLSP